MRILPLLTLTLTPLAIAASARADDRIYALTADAKLIWFYASAPSAVTEVGPISGLSSGQALRGIDFRPADGRLYAVSNGTNSTIRGNTRLWTVNLDTAEVSPVGDVFNFAGNTSTRLSVDFDPVRDELRLVTGTRLNRTLSPFTGQILASATSIFAPTGDPLASQTIEPADIAYAGAACYAIEAVELRLGLLGSADGITDPADNGRLTTLARTAPGILPNDASAGFDIGPTGIAYLTTGTARFVPPSTYVFDDFDDLYTVNLANGKFTLLGDTGRMLVDAAVVIPELSTSTLAALLLAAGLRRRRRVLPSPE
jgi:hypothetical protein